MRLANCSSFVLLSLILLIAAPTAAQLTFQPASADFGQVQVDTLRVIEIELTSGRPLPGKSVFVVRFAGIDSREAAEALVGQTLMVPADDRPELEEGEFHLLDLVGLEARLSAEGEAIGTVSDLISGGNELLELKTTDGRTLMVPFVEAIVPEVHLEGGWLLLTPPPGLLEL